MKKIKRLATALLLAGAALTFVSCGKSSGGTYDFKPEYKNNLTEGKSVDSITIEAISSDSKSKEDVTISKSDDYDTLREKLIKISGADLFGRNYSSKSFFLREKCLSNCTSNYKYDDSSFSNYSIINNYENNTTVYDTEFFMGNSKYYRKTTTESTGEKKKVESNKYSRLNAGTYYKLDGFTFELASNYPSKTDEFNKTGFMYLPNNYDGKTNDIFDKNQKVYLKYEAKDGSDYVDFSMARMKYSGDGYDVSYRPIELVRDNASYVTVASRSCGGISIGTDSNYTNFELFDYDNIEDDFKQYFKFKNSFKLTDRYIIIEQEKNYSIDLYYGLYEDGSITKQEAINMIKENNDNMKNNYYTYEVWINYEDIDIEYNQSEGTYSYNNKLGYDYLNYYCKTSKCEKYDGNSDDIKEDYYFEAYNFSVDDKTIQNKKTKFINSCKDGNFLDKYQFEPASKLK